MPPNFIKLHRLLKAQEEGYLNAYIICPVGIHGIGGGPLKRPSLIFKMLPPEALKSKKVTYIGDGTNVFGWVCILPRSISANHL